MKSITKSISVLIAMLVIAIGAISPASAHVDVVSTNPAADSVVNAPMSEISITFSEPPILEGSAISISNQDGSVVTAEDLQIDGSTIFVPWPSEIVTGDVTVNYRAAADDGHIVEGTFSFTYTASAESGLPSEEPSPEVSALATEMPTVIASPMPILLDEELGEQPESKTWIYVGIGSFLVIAGGWIVLRRRK
jgi:methionine-rich copper-binding protein CopC